MNRERRQGINHTHSRRAGKTEWLTPPPLLAALGQFDLDPCAPEKRPWDTARKHFTERDDGLGQEWVGRVFCNPPYGNSTAAWMRRCADHGASLALVFARTDTEWWFDQVWRRAHAVFFFCGRLTFYNVDGSKAAHNAGAPSVLVAYGVDEAERLRQAPLARHGFQGCYTALKR